jgi:hypothetical protein
MQTEQTGQTIWADEGQLERIKIIFYILYILPHPFRMGKMK